MCTCMCVFVYACVLNEIKGKVYSIFQTQRHTPLDKMKHYRALLITCVKFSNFKSSLFPQDAIMLLTAFSNLLMENWQSYCKKKKKIVGPKKLFLTGICTEPFVIT